MTFASEASSRTIDSRSLGTEKLDFISSGVVSWHSIPVGVIGLGKVGTGIAKSLMKADFDVVGYDLTESARNDAAELGVRVAESNGALACDCETIVLSLPHPDASRAAVDEKQIEVDGEKKWLYAAIDTESKLLLEIDVFSRRETDPAAAFLHRLTENTRSQIPNFSSTAVGI